MEPNFWRGMKYAALLSIPLWVAWGILCYLLWNCT